MRRGLTITLVVAISGCGTTTMTPSAHPDPSTTPRATASASPIALEPWAAIAASDVVGDTGLRLTGFAGGPEAVWFTAQRDAGGPGMLIRLDAATQEILRIPVECGSGCAAPAIGMGSVWTVMNDGGPKLVRVDASGYGDAETVALDTVHAALAIAADGDGNLWVARKDGIDLVSTTGELMRSVRAPFEDRLELGSLQATFAGPPSFGSLWAYDPAGPVVLRLDPASGTVTATIEIPGCPAIEYHRNYPEHAPLIYPLSGVDGMPDAVVASCPMDANHQYPGPMNVIDPTTNSVVAQLDLGPSYGRGVVLDGRWWVPVGPALGSDANWGLARIEPDPDPVESILESPIESGWRPDVVVSGKALWALVPPANDCVAAETPCTTVVRIDADGPSDGGQGR